MRALARPLTFALLAIAADLVSYFAIYSPFVIPRLHLWQSIPAIWWAALFTPILLVNFIAAVFLHSKHQVATFLFASALASVSANWTHAFIDPSFSPKLTEGGVIFFALQVGASIAFQIITTLPFWLLFRYLRSKSTAA